MDDIGRGIRKHRYYILPSVKRQIKNRAHHYVMSLNDKDFESPSYVSEMIKRKNEFVAKLMRNAENSFITTPKFNKEQKEQKMQTSKSNNKIFNSLSH